MFNNYLGRTAFRAIYSLNKSGDIKDGKLALYKNTITAIETKKSKGGQTIIEVRADNACSPLRTFNSKNETKKFLETWFPSMHTCQTLCTTDKEYRPTIDTAIIFGEWLKDDTEEMIKKESIEAIKEGYVKLLDDINNNIEKLYEYRMEAENKIKEFMNVKKIGLLLQTPCYSRI